MFRLKEAFTIRRAVAALALFALVMIGLAPMMSVATARASEDAKAQAWKDITMIYTTDVKGKIEPCG